MVLILPNLKEVLCLLKTSVQNQYILLKSANQPISQSANQPISQGMFL
jgi:hypothetical protein